MLIKPRVIGLPYGEKKLSQYVKPFSSNNGTLRTDRQTDGRTDGQTNRIPILVSRVSMLTRDKNERHDHISDMFLVFCVLRKTRAKFCQ